MFAVIKTGGKQYRVATNDVIKVEKIAGEAGDIVELGQVLMVSGDKGVEIGNPLVAGVTVAAEVLSQERGDTIIIFKKRRRHHYRRRNGHRQGLTAVKITEILTDGRKPQEKPVARAAAIPEAAKIQPTAAKTPETTSVPKPKPVKKASAKRAATKTAAKPKSAGKAKPKRK
jgi:large subunit ribosomal protein L21